MKPGTDSSARVVFRLSFQRVAQAVSSRSREPSGTRNYEQPGTSIRTRAGAAIPAAIRSDAAA